MRAINHLSPAKVPAYRKARKADVSAAYQC